MKMVNENPTRGVVKPKIIYPEKQVYTIEEAQQLLELFEHEKDENFQFVVFFTLAMYTGFWRGELLGLEWRDIDFETGIVAITRTSAYIRGVGMITDTPKTTKSSRCIKLPARTADQPMFKCRRIIFAIFASGQVCGMFHATVGGIFTQRFSSQAALM